MLAITMSVAIQSISTINFVAALSLLSGADYMIVFDADQVLALATFYLELHMNATQLAGLFWALWLLPAGYLTFKSGYLNKYLGILLMAGGVGYLTVFIQTYLFPTLGVISIPGGAVAGLAEMSLMVWLLVKGAKIPSKGADKESEE
jgi:hypothetical protein